MRAIIIERSQECMQVASIIPPKYFGKDENVRPFANDLKRTWHVNDVDVIAFDTIEELNQF